MAETVVIGGPVATEQYWADEVVKLTDTSRDTTTTLADDPDLNLTLATGRWFVHLEVACFSVSGTPRIKTAFGVSGGLVIDETTWIEKLASVRFPNSIDHDGSFDDVEAEIITLISASQVTFITFKLNFNVTTAGILSFRWAQNVSNASATVVMENSLMRSHRIADV